MLNYLFAVILDNLLPDIFFTSIFRPVPLPLFPCRSHNWRSGNNRMPEPMCAGISTEFEWRLCSRSAFWNVATRPQQITVRARSCVRAYLLFWFWWWFVSRSEIDLGIWFLCWYDSWWCALYLEIWVVWALSRWAGSAHVTRDSRDRIPNSVFERVGVNWFITSDFVIRTRENIRKWSDYRLERASRLQAYTSSSCLPTKWLILMKTKIGLLLRINIDLCAFNRSIE